MTKKIDLSTAPRRDGTLYPAEFAEPCRGRRRIRVGDAAGLTQFGVNLCTVPPGSWSSQRHWHSKEDELIQVVSGEVVLVTDEGEEILRAGDWAGFKAGDSNGHSFQNRSNENVVLLEIGSRFEDDETFYPDLDMRTVNGKDEYFHRDGKTSYGPQPRRT